MNVNLVAMEHNMKIGVFDSGIGGLSVANALEVGLPEHEVIFMNDRAHMPYGEKTSTEVLERTVPVIKNLIAEGCELIVVACNTVSTTHIKDLRSMFPKIEFVAIEPMVKPAAERTKTKVIAVCATPNTLKSERYAWLKKTYASEISVIEPDCSDWAYMIEQKNVDEKKIAAKVEEALSQKADVIVLGCTHYKWIEQEIQTLAKGRAEVIQPEKTIVRRVKYLIGR